MVYALLHLLIKDYNIPCLILGKFSIFLNLNITIPIKFTINNSYLTIYTEPATILLRSLRNELKASKISLNATVEFSTRLSYSFTPVPEPAL